LSQRVYLAGHRGLLGSALTRRLGERSDVLLVHDDAGSVDLRDEIATSRAISAVAPDVLVLSAGRVGGLGANLTDPVGFLEDNLRIQLNVMRAAHAAGVERLLFIASANAYPAAAAQPICEEALGTGALDPDTEPYGLAKLTGIRLCDSYRRQHGRNWHSVVPCNLYGPGDRFDLETAHVVAATLRRFHYAIERRVDDVIIWGSGNQRRQLLFVDDLARACELLLRLDTLPSHVNVAPFGDTSIRELAEMCAEIVGFEGRITFDANRPEGVSRRELDPKRIHDLGWNPVFDLLAGLRRTWAWFEAHRDTVATFDRAPE
jgi:GDP-L-fucose synthase